MTDIALVQKDNYIDIAFGDDGLQADPGLHTAVLLSLFTDRRAADDDAIPDNSTDQRGWWADAVAEEDGDLFGSRLWLQSREKLTASVIQRAEEYAREALQWLVDDGVASSVSVEAERIATNKLGFLVRIQRPDGSQETMRFDQLWEGLLNAV